MKICFYFPSLKNDQNRAIFGNMYNSFLSELNKLGINAYLTTEASEIDGEILITSIGGNMERLAAKAMHKFQGPVILSTYNANLCFNRPFLRHWKSRILFAYNPDYATLNFKKYGSEGISYYHFPFGSDENVFFPLYLPKQYDIAFLGNANSGYGREKYISRLIKYAKDNNLNVFLAGYGWEKFGYPYQIVEHGTATNEIYNSAKICINIHNDRQYAGLDTEMDANNRLFDLAMAQCCEISNGESMVSKYFERDEVITADDPDIWIEKIDYYLKHESERNKISSNARKRAIKDHSWRARAEDFAKMIEENYTFYADRTQKSSLSTFVFRYLDQYLMPLYLLKEIRIVKYFSRKFSKKKISR